MTKYLVLLVSFFITHIYAEGQLPGIVPAHDGGACKTDIATHCAGVNPTREAIKECLKTNKDKLSAACTAQISEIKEKIKEKRKELHDICKADAEKFCAEVMKEKGKGRIVKCLRENKDKEGFGAECKTELENMKDFKKKLKN